MTNKQKALQAVREVCGLAYDSGKPVGGGYVEYSNPVVRKKMREFVYKIQEKLDEFEEEI